MPKVEVRKRVQSSHLALRFYKHDGWTKEILDQYLIRGRVLDRWADQEIRNYWFLDHEQSSQLDMERLLAEQIGEIQRWDEGRSGESDLEFLKGMNG